MSRKKPNQRGKNVKDLQYNGTKYRSVFEVNVAKELDAQRKLRKAVGEKEYKVKYESESFEYTLPTKLYVPDFKIERKDGSTIYIECKGRFLPDDRNKLLAVKRDNPDLHLVLLFYRDDPISKGAKMKCSDWAEKHGFDYAVRVIKKEWLE